MRCEGCNKLVRQDKSYVRLAKGDSYSYLCFHCHVLVLRYQTDVKEDWTKGEVLQWARETHPSAYANLKAQWYYPNGELTSLPLKLRCQWCYHGFAEGYLQYCAECIQQANDGHQQRLKAFHSKGLEN